MPPIKGWEKVRDYRWDKEDSDGKVWAEVAWEDDPVNDSITHTAEVWVQGAPMPYDSVTYRTIDWGPNKAKIKSRLVKYMRNHPDLSDIDHWEDNHEGWSITDLTNKSPEGVQ